MLSTRLSDDSILWGKWLAAVVWVAGAMLISFPVGVLSLNVMFAGTYMPSFDQVLATVFVTFAASGLGGALGVLVSLKSSSVRHAQQVLAIIVFLLAFIPITLVKLAPREITMGLVTTLTSGEPAAAGWRLASILTAVSMPVLALAQYRFRRGRIPLK